MPQDLPDTSKEAVGRRIELARVARGYHQAAFARLLGLSPQGLNSYEKGITATPYLIIAKVWQLTGATADYMLLGRRDGMPAELVESIAEAEIAPRLDGRRKG